MPGLRLTATSRGLRAGIGPRTARLHVGAGRPGISTGAGPVTVWTGLGSPSRRRGPAGAWRSIASNERDLRAAAKLEEWTTLRELESALVSAHLEDFPALAEPEKPPVQIVQVGPFQKDLVREERRGLRPWRFREWREARLRGLARANEAALEERARREAARDEEYARRQADWDRLVANDSATVIEMVDAAFDDNEHPAVPIDVDGNRLTIALLVPGVEIVPEKFASVTPTGRPSVKKRTQTARNELHLSMVSSHAVATIKEAFAVAPGINEILLLAVIRDSLAPIYTGSFERASVESAGDDPVRLLLGGRHAKINLVGRTRSIEPLDESTVSDLAGVISALRDAAENG